MVSGLFLADKPVGPTSFSVISRVRKLYGERSVGHTGTLDPMASGLLPILLGEATKLSSFLMNLEKEYRATVRLGVVTDSFDAAGKVTSIKDASHVRREDVEQVLSGFIGRIAQRPPVFSAIKRDGKRMYDRARAGEIVEMEAREVVIYSITLDKFTIPDVDITVRCGSGTYIRSLANDMGEQLNVGGHLVALRRTRIGNFCVDNAVDPFKAVAAPALLPGAAAIEHLPFIMLDAEQVRRIRMGQQDVLESISAPVEQGAVRLVDQTNGLVAIAHSNEGHLKLARVFTSSSG